MKTQRIPGGVRLTTAPRERPITSRQAQLAYIDEMMRQEAISSRGAKTEIQRIRGRARLRNIQMQVANLPRLSRVARCRRDVEADGKFSRQPWQEARADSTADNISGYAAVYYRDGDAGSEYELAPQLVERIAPGAFDRAVREDDVRALINHNSDLIIGRKSSGTLRLKTDSRGLFYSIDPPRTSIGHSAVRTIERGDVSGSSFAFAVRAIDLVTENHGTRTARIIQDVDLFDVGPVTYPAYLSTTVEVA